MTKKVNIEGMKKAEALTVLIREGYDYAEAEKYWKDNRPQSTGFAAGFYALLEKGPMDEAQFDDIIAGGSNNVQNHKSHYNAIRELANTIWANK